MDMGWFWLRRCHIVVYFAHLDEIGRSRMIEAFIRALTVQQLVPFRTSDNLGKLFSKKRRVPVAIWQCGAAYCIHYWQAQRCLLSESEYCDVFVVGGYTKVPVEPP